MISTDHTRYTSDYFDAVTPLKTMTADVKDVPIEWYDSDVSQAMMRSRITECTNLFPEIVKTFRNTGDGHNIITVFSPIRKPFTIEFKLQTVPLILIICTI